MTAVTMKSGSQTVRVVQSASPIPVTGVGSGGGDNPVTLPRYLYTQPNALASWMIPHSLGYYPAVTILDSDNQVVAADVEHLSTAVVSITFSQPTRGKAILN